MAAHAAHNAATVATKAKDAMRPIPLPAATAALMAKMAAVASQKAGGAATRWSTTPRAYRCRSTHRSGVGSGRRPPYSDLGPAGCASSDKDSSALPGNRRLLPCAAEVPQSCGIGEGALV